MGQLSMSIDLFALHRLVLNILHNLLNSHLFVYAHDFQITVAIISFLRFVGSSAQIMPKTDYAKIVLSSNLASNLIP